MSADRIRLASRGLLAVIFTGAGVLHFTKTGAYERIMPPYLPLHREAVYASGVAEIACGAALLVPSLRVPARWGLVALLLGVFPANLHMALNPDEFKGIPEAALWARLPLQFGLIAWILAVTPPPTRRERARAKAAQALSTIRSIIS